MKYLIALLVCGGALAVAAPPSHNLVTNLNYRIERGDLDGIVPAPFKSFRGLRLQRGTEALLQDCIENRQKWSRDPLINRFGHHQPWSAIGCRERASPSVHAVFFESTGGQREAWIHFDLHGPGNLMGHAGEVIRNRLVFGRTSQYNVYRGLLRESTQDRLPVPPRHYDFAAHTSQYLKETFGPRAVVMAMVTASAAATIDHADGWGDGIDRYANRWKANLARQTIRNSIEFGASMLLQQDQRFTPSGETQTGRRIKSALYRSFFVRGDNGNELAFPRLAAAFGTGWIAHQWQPWQRQDPDPWFQTTRILSTYVMRSFWSEFKPDIKASMRKHIKILDRD